MKKYIYLSILSLLIFLYFYISFKNKKEISEIIDLEYFGNKNINEFMSFYVFIVVNKRSYFSSLLNSKIIISIKNLYGEKLLSKYETIFLSKKLAILSSLIAAMLLLNAIFDNGLILIASLIFIFLTSKLVDSRQLDLYKKHRDNLKSDLPAFISRLSLLINSGIKLRESINYISENSQGELVDMFNYIKELINNGYSELEAYNEFLLRNDDILIRKFITNIVSNLQKGGDDLEKILELMKKESDEYKKTNLILKTQEATGKLLIPNLIIFTGILIMVMLPILLNVI